MIEFLVSFFLFSFFSFFYSEMKSQNSAFICFLAAFTEPCAKNGLPPPRPFNSLFTFFTSSLMSPFRSPMGYFYTSVSLPAKRAAMPPQVFKMESVHFLTSAATIESSMRSTMPFPAKEAAFTSKLFCFSCASCPFKS